MVNWELLGILHIKKYCNYYGIPTEEKTESELIQLLNQVNDKQFIEQKQNLSLEELHIDYLQISKTCTMFMNGFLYTITTNRDKISTLTILHLAGFFIAQTVELTSNFNINFEKKGLFFYKETLYYMFDSSLFSIDIQTGEVEIEIKENSGILPPGGEFLTCQNDKIWILASDLNSVLVYHLKTKKLEIAIQFDHNVKYDVQNIISMVDNLILPDIINLKTFTRFHMMQVNNSESYFNSMLFILEKIIFGAYYLENDVLYVGGGFLNHYLGLKSNEVHVFDFKDEKHEVHYLPIRIHPDFVYFDGENMYMINSSNEYNNISHFRITFSPKTPSKFEPLLASKKYSDIIIQVEKKNYKLHKFILHEFTLLDLNKDFIELDISTYEMKFIIEWMYKGSTKMDPDVLNNDRIKRNFGITINEIKENNHISLFNLIEYSKSFHDFEIICEGGKFKFYVHKAILYFKSDYFKLLFDGEFQDSKSTSVNLNDFSKHDIGTLMKYFYLEEVIPKDFKEIVHFIDLSQFFLSEGFENKLWSCMHCVIDKTNCFSIYEFISDFKTDESKKMKKVALKFIKQFYTIKDVMKIVTKLRRNKEEIKFKRKKFE
eukprot:gene2397-2861_t